jgi:hypothetical protein
MSKALLLLHHNLKPLFPAERYRPDETGQLSSRAITVGGELLPFQLSVPDKPEDYEVMIRTETTEHVSVVIVQSSEIIGRGLKMFGKNSFADRSIAGTGPQNPIQTVQDIGAFIQIRNRISPDHGIPIQSRHDVIQKYKSDPKESNITLLIRQTALQWLKSAPQELKIIILTRKKTIRKRRTGMRKKNVFQQLWRVISGVWCPYSRPCYISFPACWPAFRLCRVRSETRSIILRPLRINLNLFTMILPISA